MGAEVGGRGLGGRMGSDWVVGGRRLGVGMGGRLRGRLGVRRESDPTYLQSNNKHTRNNQCKMIMGNIIVCPAGPKKFKY